jgi:hypothetical protein
MELLKMIKYLYLGDTNLQLAIINGNTKLIKKLINEKTDISTLKDCIYFSTTANNTDITLFFLDKITNQHKSTHLKINYRKIIQTNNVSIFKELLKYNIDLKRIPWELTKQNKVRMLYLLIKSQKKILKNQNKIVPLVFISLKHNSNDCTKLLLTQLTNEYLIQKDNQKSFIFLSSYNNNYEITEYLLTKYKVNPNQITRHSYTKGKYSNYPLSNAIINKNHKLIDLLLDHNSSTKGLHNNFKGVFFLGHNRLIQKIIQEADIELLYKMAKYHDNEYIKYRIFQHFLPLLSLKFFKNTDLTFIGLIIKSFLTS